MRGKHTDQEVSPSPFEIGATGSGVTVEALFEVGVVALEVRWAADFFCLLRALYF
jgi:hypothetical protein